MFSARNSDEGRVNRSASNPPVINRRNNTSSTSYAQLGESEESLDLSHLTNHITPNISHDSDLITDLDRDSHDNMLVHSKSRRGSAPTPVNHDYQHFLSNGMIPPNKEIHDENVNHSIAMSSVSSRAMSTGFLYIPTPDTNVDYFVGDGGDADQVW